MNGPEMAGPDSHARDRDHETIARLRRSLLLDPFAPAALAELAHHARATQDWVRLALLHARRFAVAGSEAERAAIALELADLEHRELSNPAAARAWLCRGIEAAPETPALYDRILVLLEVGRGAVARKLAARYQALEPGSVWTRTLERRLDGIAKPKAVA